MTAIRYNSNQPSIECECDNCSGFGEVECPECDGQGTLELYPEDLPKDHIHREELIMITKDIQRVNEQAARLTKLLPQFKLSYESQLKTTSKELFDRFDNLFNKK